MKKFYKTDWFLKVVSILVSIMLWIYVAYFQNPEYERWIRDIPIVKTNSSSEFESGKLYISDSSMDKIDIKVKGSRKTVAKLNNKNIRVNVDLFGVVSKGEYVLDTNVFFPVNGIEIVQKQPYNYTLKVDEVVSVEKKITIEYSGALKEGRILESVNVEPEYIKLTGPENVVSTIDRTVITVDLSDKSNDFKESCYVKLYSGKKEFSDKSVTKNIEYADVKVEVCDQKEVEVNIKNINRSENVKFSSPKVLIKGNSKTLEKITSVNTKIIDASRLNGRNEIEIELDLPEGVELISGNDNKITVKIVYEN